MTPTSTRTTWLIQQPTYWLGLLVTMLTALVACGVIPAGGTASRVVAAVLSVLNQYGVTAAHFLNPPRIPLDEMSAEEREKLFDKFPSVRERWEAEQLQRAMELQAAQLQASAPISAATKAAYEPRIPPPLPPAPGDDDKKK